MVDETQVLEEKIIKDTDDNDDFKIPTRPGLGITPPRITPPLTDKNGVPFEEGMIDVDAINNGADGLMGAMMNDDDGESSSDADGITIDASMFSPTDVFGFYEEGRKTLYGYLYQKAAKIDKLKKEIFQSSQKKEKPTDEEWKKISLMQAQLSHFESGYKELDRYLKIGQFRKQILTKAFGQVLKALAQKGYKVSATMVILFCGILLDLFIAFAIYQNIFTRIPTIL